MKKKNTIASALLTVFLSACMLTVGFAVPAAVNTAHGDTAAVTNVTVVISTDGKTATIEGDIPVADYSTQNLMVVYGQGNVMNHDAPITIGANNADGTEDFLAAITGVPAGTYTYSITDDDNPSFTGGDGTFTIGGTTANSTTVTVSNLKVVPGAAGTSVTITGSISGPYSADSLVIAYGTNSNLNQVGAATVTPGSSGTDTFSATLTNVAPGSYAFGVGDENTFTFAGSSGSFVLTGTATGNSGSGTGGTGGNTTTGNTGGTTGTGNGNTTTGSTGGTTGTGLNFKLNNPIVGVDTIPDFLAKVINAILLVLTPVVVIMFIYSGFLFVQAQGNEEKIAKAKQTLIYTLIGAAVILGSKGIALAVQQTVTQF